MAKKVASDPVNARLEALNTALGTIERKYGKGAVMKLSDDVQVDVPVIPTGSIGLDQALGVGGIPRGRVTEIFGPESSGKTTLTLHIIAECQKMGGICAFIDAEHALDVAYARKLGVNTDELLISQPDYGEQALDIADMLVRSGGVDLVVIDSVAALIPQAELDGDMGETQVGGHARLMSQIDGHNPQIAHFRCFHQPDSHENRQCLIRKPRNHNRRQCAQVLFFRPY